MKELHGALSNNSPSHKRIIHVSGESKRYWLAASLHSFILWHIKQEDLPYYAIMLPNQAAESGNVFFTFYITWSM
jgi:hypothetical protein